MAKDDKGHGSAERGSRSATAYVHDVHTAYPTKEPKEVRVGPSKARAAGPEGVQFTAPGWRPMIAKDMLRARNKIESHPGFSHWKEAEPRQSPIRSTTQNRKY